MANLKVFVSSTCYDLAIIRGQLRQFILSLGHEPVLSEYNDVLYDPQTHTHTSCVREIAGVDAVVLIIGARFGGTAIPEALKAIDIQTLADLSSSKEFLQDSKISITQLEVLRAIQSSIPVFAFVEERVLNDHATYERNKTKAIIGDIEFSSIERPETARYIFEFINFLRHRGSNNAVFSFSRLQDIEETLRKQWSALLQQLLSDARTRQTEARRIDALTEQLEDLKTAILTEVGGNKRQLEIARGVVRFRRLLDFVRGFELSDYDFLWGPAMTWEQLLQRLDVKEIYTTQGDFTFSFRTANGVQRSPALYIKNDGTFYSVDRTFDLPDMQEEFRAFMALSPESRKVIVDALAEVRPSLVTRRYIIHHNMTVEEYLDKTRTESELLAKKPPNGNDDWAKFHEAVLADIKPKA